MSFFRTANAEEVVRVMAPDGENWVDLRGEFSKDQVNKVLMVAPRSAEDIEGSIGFIESFANVAIMDWSMTNAAGDKVPFHIKTYKNLAHEPAQWLDKTLAQHFKNTIGDSVEEDEGKLET